MALDVHVFHHAFSTSATLMMIYGKAAKNFIASGKLIILVLSLGLMWVCRTRICKTCKRPWLWAALLPSTLEDWLKVGRFDLGDKRFIPLMNRHCQQWQVAVALSWIRLKILSPS